VSKRAGVAIRGRREKVRNEKTREELGAQ